MTGLGRNRFSSFTLALTIASVLACGASADDEGIEVLFSSGNAGGQAKLADRICDLIGGAEKSIDVAVAHLNYERIAQAIADRKKAVPGLEIRVLLDYSEYGALSRTQGPLLEKAGIPVRYKLYSLSYYHLKASLMHHKFMVVDGESVVAGSYNWSETAERSNDENILVFKAESHAEVVDSFHEEFEELWSMGRRTYPAFKRALLDPDGPRYIPIHFNTRYFSTAMSLSRNEIEPLMTAARKSGLYDVEKSEEMNYFDRREKTAVNEIPTRGSFLRPAGDEPGKRDEKPAKGEEK